MPFPSQPPQMPAQLGQGMMAMGPPPPAPPGAMEALGGLQAQPSPGGESDALQHAAMEVGMALSRAYLRSPDAAEKLSKALTLITQARQDLEQAQQSPVGLPPDLGGGMGPLPMGGM